MRGRRSARRPRPRWSGSRPTSRAGRASPSRRRGRRRQQRRAEHVGGRAPLVGCGDAERDRVVSHPRMVPRARTQASVNCRGRAPGRLEPDCRRARHRRVSEHDRHEVGRTRSGDQWCTSGSMACSSPTSTSCAPLPLADAVQLAAGWTGPAVPSATALRRCGHRGADRHVQLWRLRVWRALGASGERATPRRVDRVHVVG